MQVTANKPIWYSLLGLAAALAFTAPSKLAAQTLRIVHVTPAAGAVRLAHNSITNGLAVQVHAPHPRHRRHADRPRFVTERTCHRHGTRRHCHTTVRRIAPRQFGFATRELHRNSTGGRHHGYRSHGRRPRNSGFNFIVNL